MKLKKYSILGLLIVALSVSGTILNIKAVDDDSVKDGPEQNQYFSIIDEKGNVIIHQYKEEDNEIETLDSNDYKVVKTIGEHTTEINTFDTYEEAKNEVSKLSKYRSGGTYDIQAISTKSVTNGVARIKGYTTYKEVENGKQGRTGYTHGSSANDAAYISTSSDESTIRIKQAGVVMDVPAGKIEISEYTSSSKVSYYKSVSGKLYHYYYYNEGQLAQTQVGYTPDYMSNNVKYYSYDGHYFYKDYKTMLNDYKTGFDYYAHSINSQKPYYNYYQYLSLRSSTKLSASHINKLVTDVKGVNTSSKLKNQGQALLNNQNKYGINASLMFGVAVNESGWGMSHYSQDRNNLFGINANDSNPDDAYSFSTVESCFNYFAYNMISRGYLDGMDARYRGGHLGDKRSGINVKYASDPYWGEKAASFSYTLNDASGNKDYQSYTLAISKKTALSLFKDANTKTEIYDTSVNDKNGALYCYSATILSTSGGYYKILSDTVLNQARTAQNADGIFDVSRDYVYIRSSDVNLRGATVSNQYKKGDVNGDQKIDSMDMYQITQHILKKITLTGNSFNAADTDGNGKIDSMDMYNVIQIILKN